MSELINNLNTIYTTKLQIKEVIGTESDDFTQYPSYISNLLPSGTSYITNNGDYNISSYEYVNVNVSGGGSTGTVIDEASDLFDGGAFEEGEYIGPADGDDVDVRGLTINSWGVLITNEFVESWVERFPNTEQILTDNIGSYLLPVSIPGGDGQPYFIYPTQASPDQSIYSVKGSWGNYGNPGTESAYFFIVSDVTSLDLIPRGGSGELVVSESGDYDVSTYAALTVTGGGGGGGQAIASGAKYVLSVDPNYYSNNSAYQFIVEEEEYYNEESHEYEYNYTYYQSSENLGSQGLGFGCLVIDGSANKVLTNSGANILTDIVINEAEESGEAEEFFSSEIGWKGANEVKCVLTNGAYDYNTGVNVLQGAELPFSYLLRSEYSSQAGAWANNRYFLAGDARNDFHYQPGDSFVGTYTYLQANTEHGNDYNVESFHVSPASWTGFNLWGSVVSGAPVSMDWDSENNSWSYTFVLPVSNDPKNINILCVADGVTGNVYINSNNQYDSSSPWDPVNDGNVEVYSSENTFDSDSIWVVNTDSSAIQLVVVVKPDPYEEGDNHSFQISLEYDGVA